MYDPIASVSSAMIAAAPVPALLPSASLPAVQVRCGEVMVFHTVFFFGCDFFFFPSHYFCVWGRLLDLFCGLVLDCAVSVSRCTTTISSPPFLHTHSARTQLPFSNHRPTQLCNNRSPRGSKSVTACVSSGRPKRQTLGLVITALSSNACTWFLP